MKAWQNHRLGDVVDEGGGSIQTGPFGSQLHASDYVAEGIPCIMPANMKNNRVDVSGIARISEHDANRLKRHIVKTGDIVYSRRGDITQKALIRENENGFFCGTGCLLLRPGKKIDPAFLTYYLSTKTYQLWIASQAVGATMPNLNTGILNRVSFCAPDKDDQERIASVLTALDAKIELNNRINAELEGMAKLLYDYWFVQFDFPMSASQAAALGKPHLTGHPYRASGGKMNYNKTLKREIPEGWSDQSISCMIASDKAGDWGEETAIGNYQTEVYCLRGTDINSLNGNGTTTPPKRFILRKNEFKLLKPNDLIIEISGGSPTQSTGRASALLKPVFARFDKPLICSNFCKALSLKLDTSIFYFYRTWAGLYDAGVFFNWEGKTSGIKNLLFDSFVNNHRVVNPDKEITRQFDEILTPFEKIKQANLIQNQELTQLRDWLLPMLMNGQVTVN